MARLTEKEYLEILVKQKKPKSFIDSMKKILESKTEKENKYKNRKITIWNKVFDSKLEASRYFDLMLLERHWTISELKTQVPFVLLEDYWKVRWIKYIADFTYIQDWKTYVEDVKSPATAKLYTYKNKIKMLKRKYPDIVFVEYQK